MMARHYSLLAKIIDYVFAKWFLIHEFNLKVSKSFWAQLVMNHLERSLDIG